MTKLIEALKDNNYKIISYTDQFGQGKTTKLKEMMKDENYKNDFEFVLYDSFKYEWAGNKKITFIYEILNEIGFNKKMNDKDEGIKSKVEKIWEKIKSINVTFGYTYHNHAFSMSLSSKEKSPTFIENEIRNYISQNEQLDSFKSGLGEYIKEFFAGKSLVLIIDDLDRIHPESALEIIEIAKHLFDIDNFKVLLVFDKEAMDSLYSKKYGKRAGEKYLNKYIDKSIIHQRPYFSQVANNDISWIFDSYSLDKVFMNEISIRDGFSSDFLLYVRFLNNFYRNRHELSIFSLGLHIWKISENDNIFNMNNIFWNEEIAPNRATKSDIIFDKPLFENNVKILELFLDDSKLLFSSFTPDVEIVLKPIWITNKPTEFITHIRKLLKFVKEPSLNTYLGAHMVITICMIFNYVKFNKNFTSITDKYCQNL